MILINSSSKSSLKIFHAFLPSFVPVAAGWIIAVAMRNNIKVKFFDEHVEDNLWEKINLHVKEMERPYIFAFSILTASFNNAIALSKKLKEKYPDSITLFGGVHPSALPDESLLFPNVDFVFRGEVDLVFADLYATLKNHGDVTKIRGLSYKKNGVIVHNPAAPIVTNLDELPDFPYHLFKNKKEYDFDFIGTSRGCPYDCIFCSNRVVTGKKYRYKSTEKVFAEIEKLFYEYNQRTIGFIDDNLLVNKNRIYDLIKLIRASDMYGKIVFTFQTRADNVDEKIMREMFEVGFKTIFFGIESASDRLLKIVKKGEKLEDIENAVIMAKKIGFHVYSTFIYGLPTENHADRMACVKMGRRLKIDTIRFNNATPYPGTELYRIAKQEGRLNVVGLYENFLSVSVLIENPFFPIKFSYVPEGSTENEIRKDILLSYLYTYLNFSILKRIMLRPDSSIGKINKVDRIIFVISKIPAGILLLFFLCVKFSMMFLYVVFYGLKRK